MAKLRAPSSGFAVVALIATVLVVRVLAILGAFGSGGVDAKMWIPAGVCVVVVVAIIAVLVRAVSIRERRWSARVEALTSAEEVDAVLVEETVFSYRVRLLSLELYMEQRRIAGLQPAPPSKLRDVSDARWKWLMEDGTRRGLISIALNALISCVVAIGGFYVLVAAPDATVVLVLLSLALLIWVGLTVFGLRFRRGPKGQIARALVGSLDASPEVRRGVIYQAAVALETGASAGWRARRFE